MVGEQWMNYIRKSEIMVNDQIAQAAISTTNESAKVDKPVDKEVSGKEVSGKEVAGKEVAVKEVAGKEVAGKAGGIVETAKSESALSTVHQLPFDREQYTYSIVDKLMKVVNEQRPRRLKGFMNFIGSCVPKTTTEDQKRELLAELAKRNFICVYEEKVQYLF